jgi:ABC-2 type transport system permease protein
MRKIFAIIGNDFRVEFAERSTLFFFLVLPLVFTLIIGTALGGIGTDESGDERYVVLVVDEDSSALSQELLAIFGASEEIRPEVKNAAEAARLLEEGEALAALTIPAGFGQALLENRAVPLTLRASPEDSASLAVEQAVQAALARLDGAVQVAQASTTQAQELRPFSAEADRLAYFQASLARAQELLDSPAAQVELERSPVAVEQIAAGFEQASPGQLVTWTLITLLGTSEVFVNERLGGTLRRLLVMPTRKATILFGKVAARFWLGMLQMALLIGFGAWVLGVNWGRSPAALALLVAAFALASVALGVLLAAFAKTRGQAAGLTIFFSMLMAALGGAWWPLEITPQAYQAAVRVLPTTWAMAGFSDVILRGQGVGAVLPEVAVLLVFSALFFAVGLARLRFE